MLRMEAPNNQNAPVSLQSGDHSCIADKRDMHLARFLKAYQHFRTPWLAENCGRLCG